MSIEHWKIVVELAIGMEAADRNTTALKLINPSLTHSLTLYFTCTTAVNYVTKIASFISSQKREENSAETLNYVSIGDPVLLVQKN